MPKNTQEIFGLLTNFWNTGNSDLITQVYSDRTERMDPNVQQPTRGTQAIASYVAALHKGFSDFKLQINQQISEGDQVASEWICTGTHDGEFQGVPATGRHVAIHGLTLNRIEDGKIVEERVYFDRLSLLQQLGVVAG